MDRIETLIRDAADAITPDEQRRLRQALCDELDRLGYRPTGWVEPVRLK